MPGLRDGLFAVCNFMIGNYRQDGTGVFSEVPSDTLQDGVYRLDGLQLLLCDFTPSGTLMAARKLLSLAFQVEYSMKLG